MKFIIIGLGTVSLLLVAWLFLLSSIFVPKDYASCLKTHTNDYTKNELSCSFSPGTPAQQRLCEEKDGVINQFKQCLIIYYNPAFVFPKNFDKCLQKIGSTNGQVCDLEINKRGAYDQDLVQKLFDECLKNGSQDNTKFMSTGGCSLRFQK